jgi:hypothetical protein
MRRLLVIAIALASFGVSPYAQSQDEAGVSGKGMAWVVTGLPCTAEYLSTNTRTLSDGTHIISRQRSRAVRDSQGRVRIEIYPPSTVHKKSDEPDFVYILDPIAQREVNISSRTKIAVVTEERIPVLRPSSPLPVESQSPNPGASQSSRPESTKEAIPGKTFNGLEAAGTRTILTFPVGWEGNDQPIRNTADVYVSRSLHILVFSQSESVLSGDDVMEITQLDRGEPDSSLFQIPGGYEVTESSPRSH